MVQRILTKQTRVAVVLACALMATPAWAGKKNEKPIEKPAEILLEGGRKLAWERSFHSEREVKTKVGFWNKVLNVVAGEPDYHTLVRPYGIAEDSKGRLIITDPGAAGIHIFDFAQQRYKFIQREVGGRDPLRAPQCVTLDSADNIYVSDSESGEIFVFAPSGKLQRVIGKVKGGEGYFKRPTGIAVDSKAGRIYVTDTLRSKIFVLDMNGQILNTIGQNGVDAGQFNYPTELLLHGEELAVVDAMNFRVQVMKGDGSVQYMIGSGGDTTGSMFRPKGVAFDSEDHLYVVEGLRGIVQVFDRSGVLLYIFGGRGMSEGQFQLPTGVAIDRQDHIFIVDSINHRVQEFRYYGAQKRNGGLQ